MVMSYSGTYSMFKIKVKAKKLWKNKDIALVHYAAEYAVKRLGLNYSPIPIIIRLKGGLGEDFGYCIDLEDKICISISKNGNYLKTLFYELEHARQYVDDELDLEHTHAMWKGHLYKRKYKDYYNEPWEVKARKVEQKFYRAFTKKILDF